MSKQEDILTGQCLNIAKEDMFNEKKPIKGNEAELFKRAEAIFREGMKQGYTDLPAKVESENAN